MYWRQRNSVLALFVGFSVCGFYAHPLAAQVRAIDAVVVEHPAAIATFLPLTLSKVIANPPLAILERAEFAAPEQLEAIGEWNAARHRGRPVKTGFGRPLDTSYLVSIAPDTLEGSSNAVVEKTPSGVAWGSRIQVEGAYRLRLRLSDVRLPSDAQLWVGGDDGDVTRFGLELRREGGDLWTPSVAGNVIHIQVRIPETSLSSVSPAEFRIDSVAQIFRLDATGNAILDSILPKGTECLQDAACFDDSSLAGLSLYKEAVAHLQYMVGMDGFICSGALLNDTDTSSSIPYMLTANHCFDTQASASTLEAFFDFIAPSCGASWPDLSSLPKVTGATLLATTPTTDSTFVQLSSNPSGATGYLGWTSDEATAGTQLFRLSHPMGWAQSYSSSLSFDPSSTCQGLPSSQFIYSFPLLGATAGGSSGSPTVDGNLWVRGQLLGICGPNVGNPCDPLNAQVDGRLSEFFARIERYLDPQGGTDPCDPDDPYQVCLLDGQYVATARYIGRDGQWKQARRMTVLDNLGGPSPKTGGMAFDDRETMAIAVAMRPACSGGFSADWAGVASMELGEWELQIRRVEDGALWIRHQEFLGNTSEIDQHAFPCL